MNIPVVDIWTSIQGEGKNSGKAALFLRVAGCNFSCKWCDTKYALKVKESQELPVDMVVHKLATALEGKKITHLVITGGEPSLYFKEFERMWRSENFQNKVLYKMASIDIETNGFIPVKWEELDDKINVCISPKWDEGKYEPREIVQWKFKNVSIKLIVSSVDDAIRQIEWVREIYSIRNTQKIYLQPLNNDIEVAKALVEANCLGCRLSMQIHKILGVA